MGCVFVKSETNKCESPKKPFSWETRDAVANVQDYLVVDVESREIVRLPGSVNGQQFCIQNCRNATIYVLDHINTVTVDDCQNCTIFLGAVKGSVNLRNCIGITCIAACGQFRSRDCRKCLMLLHSATQPIIEASTSMKFGTFHLSYATHSNHVNAAGLNLSINTWTEVYDFTPVPGESNWCFVEGDFVKFTFKVRTKSVETLLKEHCLSWMGNPPITNQVLMEDSGIDSDPKTIGISRPIRDENDFNGSDSSISGNELSPATMQMHRRMDHKIYQGKKTNTNQLSDIKKNIPGHNLIPIQRLPIPSKIATAKEQLPLVEWDTDESEEDVHFFPTSKANVKSELTDTFSIEEMDLSADEDDLHLLPPKQTEQSLCCPVQLRCCLL